MSAYAQGVSLVKPMKNLEDPIANRGSNPLVTPIITPKGWLA